MSTSCISLTLSNMQVPCGQAINHLVDLVLDAKKMTSLTEAIIEFNNSGLDSCIREAFQMSLLRMVLVTIMLEDQIALSVGNLPAQLPAGSSAEWDRVRTSVQYSLTKVKYDLDSQYAAVFVLI